MRTTLEKYLRIIILIGLFLVPFIPVIVSNSLFFPFITGKNFAFRIIVEIIFGSWVLLAITDVRYRLKMKPIVIALLAFTGIMFIADIHGYYAYKSLFSNFERMEGFIGLIHLTAYFIVAAVMLSTQKLWDWLLATSVGVSIYLGFYGVMQLMNLITIDQGGNRLDATLGNATYLAVYMLFHIFIVLFYIFRNKKESLPRWFVLFGFNFAAAIVLLINTTSQGSSVSKGSSFVIFILWAVINGIIYFAYSMGMEIVFYILAIIFQSYILFFTATRGAIIGLIAGLLITAVLILIFEKKNQIIRKTAFGIVIGAVIIVGGFFAFKNTTLFKTNPVLARFSSISFTETTTKARFLVWNMALKGFKEKPLLGWGQENFNYVFNKYYNPQMYNQEQWFDRTHNVVLDWLINGGILGFAGYLSFYIAILYTIWKKIPTEDKKSTADFEPFSVTEKSIISGMLIGYFIHNLFVFDNIASYILYFTIAAYVYIRTTSQVSTIATAKAQTESYRIYAPVVIVVTLILVYVLNGNALAQAYTLIKALQQQPQGLTQNYQYFKQALDYNSFGTAEAREQLIQAAASFAQAQIPGDVRQQFQTKAEIESQAQIALTPNDARYYVFAGTLHAAYGNDAQAYEDFKKASELSPQKQTILFELGSIDMRLGKTKEALAIFKQAYDEAPESTDSQKVYALGAIYNNNFDLANSLLKDIPHSEIVNDDRFIDAYAYAKKFDIVAQFWQERIQQDPKNGKLYLSLAAAQYGGGDNKNAIANIKIAETLDPTLKAQGDQYIQAIQTGKTQ